MESISGLPRGVSTDWDAFRRQMPVTERWAYFDHAAVAPLSGPARAAVPGARRKNFRGGSSMKSSRSM